MRYLLIVCAALSTFSCSYFMSQEQAAKSVILDIENNGGPYNLNSPKYAVTYFRFFGEPTESRNKDDEKTISFSFETLLKIKKIGAVGIYNRKDEQGFLYAPRKMQYLGPGEFVYINGKMIIALGDDGWELDGSHWNEYKLRAKRVMPQDEVSKFLKGVPQN